MKASLTRVSAAVAPCAFAVVALCATLGALGCAPSGGADAPDALGTAGTTGSMGTAGTGGAGTGVAGAPGAAGTTGVAGTIGAAGTTGGAGTTGSGTAGSPGGRGGTTGAAGAGGSPGGRGGTTGVAGAGGSSGGRGGTTGGAGGAAGAGGSGQARTFSQCRFHFGAIDTIAKQNGGAVIPQLDMFTSGWIGSGENFNLGGICTDLNGVLAGKVPALVAYIIAFTARRDENLQDCNVSGSNNLCNHGATYIRAHLEDRILPQYRKYAMGFASACGTTRPMIWMMEPDYYQYNAGGDPNSLTPQEAGQIMGRIVSTVRGILPNVVFSLDISPWIPNNGSNWYSSFNMADFTFISTSGGGTEANNTRIRAANTMTWAGVRNVTGKPILADTGYGVAGQSAGHDAQWDIVSNINARITDGVIAVTQYNPNSSWTNTISQIRSQLSAVNCY